MRFTISSLFFLLPFITVTAQEIAVSKGGKAVPVLLNPNGNFITNLRSGEVKGSPMLSDEWTTGSVAFTNGTGVDSVLLLFNLETNKLLFRQQGLILEFVDTVKEAILNYVTPAGKNQVVIRSGYPVAEENAASTFYLVLAAGPRFHLLQHRLKKKVEQYSYGSGTGMVYSELNELFIYETSTGAMHRIHEKRSSLLNALPASANAIEHICREQQLKAKNTTEIITIINWLNKMEVPL